MDQQLLHYRVQLVVGLHKLALQAKRKQQRLMKERTRRVEHEAIFGTVTEKVRREAEKRQNIVERLESSDGSVCVVMEQMCCLCFQFH